MQATHQALEAHLAALPEDRRQPMRQLRQAIVDNLPPGFAETIGPKFISWSVPHSLYPAGYHCNPKDPLPFLGIASQKNFIAVYHMGMYAHPPLLAWFTAEYPKHSQRKLDMGKSCIRFNNPAHLPYALLAELAGKMTVEEWIALYERNLKKV